MFDWLLRRRRSDSGEAESQTNFTAAGGILAGGGIVTLMVTTINGEAGTNEPTIEPGSFGPANVDFDPSEHGDLHTPVPCDVPDPPFSSGNVQPVTCAGHNAIVAEFRDVILDGNCMRPSEDDHGQGRACDYMISVGETEEEIFPSDQEAQNGDDITTWVMENYEELGVDYIIWYQSMWNPGAGDCSRRESYSDEPFHDLPAVDPGVWCGMADRHSHTQNHYDHPHVSFETTPLTTMDA